MRVFKLKYRDGRSSESWYYSFYWRGKKIQNRTLCSLRTNVPKEFFTPAKLEKASARELELMRAIAFDKERLERGRSTENVGLAIYQTIMEVKKRKKELEMALEHKWG